MPTYEYECLKCGKKFDYFQPISEKPLTRCKYCKGKVKRLIGTGGGIIFKGSGFYVNDYAKKSVGKKEKNKPAQSCPAQGESCKNCPKADNAD